MGHKADSPSVYLVQQFVKHFGFVKLRDAFIVAMKKNHHGSRWSQAKLRRGLVNVHFCQCRSSNRRSNRNYLQT